MANRKNDTPAYITYTPNGGNEVELRFHAVVAEDHAATSQITKFPVQSGFDISNNSIRKNRTISITGLITNTVLDGTKNDYFYSDTSNTKTVFETLEGLVTAAYKCEVTTNLGEYSPVVFTKFTTKQVEGMVDAMQFTIFGEEIQVAGTVSGSAPKLLSFTILQGVEKDNKLIELTAAGIKACPNAVVSEANLTIGQDFIIEGQDTAGKSVSSTYLATGQDSTTSQTHYNMHTSSTEFYRDQANLTQAAIGGEGEVVVAAGFQDVGNCLATGATTVGVDAVTDFLNTEVGLLKQSLYGALYSTMSITDNEYGQELIHAGVGCIVRTGTNVVSRFPYQPGEALPTVDQMIDSAADYASALTGTDINKTTNGLIGTPTTLTKIEGC